MSFSILGLISDISSWLLSVFCIDVGDVVVDATDFCSPLPAVSSLVTDTVLAFNASVELNDDGFCISMSETFGTVISIIGMLPNMDSINLSGSKGIMSS